MFWEEKANELIRQCLICWVDNEKESWIRNSGTHEWVFNRISS